jgi:hypothetical protein
MKLPMMTGIIAAAAALGGAFPSTSIPEEPMRIMPQFAAFPGMELGRGYRYMVSLNHPPGNQRQKRKARRRAHAAGKRHAFA